MRPTARKEVGREMNPASDWKSIANHNIYISEQQRLLE